MADNNFADKVAAYLDRLKSFIPARSLSLLLAINTLIAGVSPTDAPAWLILTADGVVFVVSLIGSAVLDHKPFVAILLSAIALLLFIFSTPGVGPWTAFGVTSNIPFIVVGVLIVLFVTIVPWFYKGPLAGPEQLARIQRNTSGFA